MEQIRRGSLSHYADYLSVMIRPDEAAAKLETLRMLGRAIMQGRQVLAERLDHTAKIEATVQMH
jgi:hypothetical protein